MQILFGLESNLTIVNRSFKTAKEAGYSFVVEKLSWPIGSPEFDCLEGSSPSLRPLIASCLGFVRARELTNREKEQIQKFQNNPNGRCPFQEICLYFAPKKSKLTDHLPTFSSRDQQEIQTGQPQWPNDWQITRSFHVWRRFDEWAGAPSDLNV